MNILDNSILNRIPEYCGEGHNLSEADEAMMLYLLLGKYNFMGCEHVGESIATRSFDITKPDRHDGIGHVNLYNLLRARLVEIAGKEATEELYEGFHLILDVLQNKLAQSTPLDCAENFEDTGDCDSLDSYGNPPDNDVVCSDDLCSAAALRSSASRDYSITSDGNTWVIVYSDEDNCTHDYCDYDSLEWAEEDLKKLKEFYKSFGQCQGGE